MNRKTEILMVVGLVLATGIGAQAQYDDGDGSPNDPFQIAEPNQLIYMSQHHKHWDQHFILTADLNMNLAEPNTFTTAVIASDPYISGGFDGMYFMGVFDGNNHIIANLTVDTAGAFNDYLGLFGYIRDSSAEVKNLGLDNVKIIGGNNSDYLGGLCGYNHLGAKISNCYANGSVTGKVYSRYLGGLCGGNRSGNISHCNFTGSVTSGVNSSFVGGLCGHTRDGDISNCYASGSVTVGDDSDYLGGLCGWSMYGSTIQCYANGSVTAGDNTIYIGGLCGNNNYNDISNCYATGAVTCGNDSEFLGGLCGKNDFGNTLNCYARGMVTSGNYTSYLGSLCGMNDFGSTISNCYASGSVSGGNNIFFIGGLCGYNDSGSINNSYFLNTAGPHNGIGQPLNDLNLKIRSNFVGWDFVDEEDNGSEDIWRMCVDRIEYPKLYWQFHLADFTCPDGVEIYDLWYLTTQWLIEGNNLRCDIAPIANPDEIVNLHDYNEFTKHWPME